MARAELAYDHHSGFFLPKKLPAGLHAAGRLMALNDPEAIEASGRLAGLSAAYDCVAADTAKLARAKKALEACPQPDRGCKLVMAPVKGTVQISDSLSTVVTTMIHHGVDLIPVLEVDRVVGVVLMTNIFDIVAQFIIEHGGSTGT